MKYVTLTKMCKHIEVDPKTFLEWDSQGLIPQEAVMIMPNGEKRYAFTRIINSWRLKPVLKKEGQAKIELGFSASLKPFIEGWVAPSAKGIGIRELHAHYLKWYEQSEGNLSKPFTHKELVSAMSEEGVDRVRSKTKQLFFMLELIVPNAKEDADKAVMIEDEADKAVMIEDEADKAGKDVLSVFDEVFDLATDIKDRTPSNRYRLVRVREMLSEHAGVSLYAPRYLNQVVKTFMEERGVPKRINGSSNEYFLIKKGG